MQGVLVALLLGSSAQLLADEGRDFLRTLRQNPHQVMNQKPHKYRPDGTKIDDGRQWPKHTRAFRVHNAAIKHAIDQQILGEGKQGWEAHDDPHYLFEEGVEVETNIMRLPPAGKLTYKPWSAYYWPIATGGVSLRYGDPDFNALLAEESSKDEGVSYERVISYYTQPADLLRLQPLVVDKHQKMLDMYSPAEKYDLLVGSEDFKLTQYVKERGRRYMDENGSVAMWMGICHGWAVASYASPRPAQSIAVRDTEGKTTINFYPDDLRALLSLKWAASSSWDGLFIGGRCNAQESPENDDDAKRIRIDEKTGRVLDAECFDTNPGTWHTVITNKIGRYDESFIMDATFDAEVWNQPVYAYRARYYHPRTEKVGTLAESIMPINEQWQDTFKDFRQNGKAKKIVVVQMEVTYVVETEPRSGEPYPDSLSKVTYWYDLELDAQNNIVGGEWYSNYHPDFLWTKKRSSRPQNTIDSTISRLIDPKATVREFVTTRNVRSFNKAMLGRLAELSDLSVRMDGTPLELLIYGLVELAR